MALKAIVAKLDDVPEAVRGEYAEKDGKFYLSVDAVDGWSLEDVTGLKTALSTERTTRSNLEAQVVKFKDLDPDKARAALTELETLRAIDPTKEADKIANTKFEAAKAQLLDSHKTELGTRDERINGLTKTVDSLVREQRATAAIAAAKGSVELLLPHVLNHSRSVEKDGKWVVEVVKDGIVQLDNKGDPLTIDAFVGQMRASETYARAFDGEGHTGSSKQPGDEGYKPPGGKGDMGGSRDERTAAIAKKFNLPTS